MKIPNIVMVGCNDFEVVIAWSEVDVAGNAFMRLLPPIFICANQSISKLDPLRRNERVRRVFELDDPPVTRRNPHYRSSRREEVPSASDFGFRISDFERSLLTPTATSPIPAFSVPPAWLSIHDLLIRLDLFEDYWRWGFVERNRFRVNHH